MPKNNLLADIDRSVDYAYDSIYILNAAVTAIVEGLGAQSAARVMQALDVSLDDLLIEENPPGPGTQETLLGWRNMAAKRAAMPRRPRGA